jgi:hypothetical protein
MIRSFQSLISSNQPVSLPEITGDYSVTTGDLQVLLAGDRVKVGRKMRGDSGVMPGLAQPFLRHARDHKYSEY